MFRASVSPVILRMIYIKARMAQNAIPAILPRRGSPPRSIIIYPPSNWTESIPKLPAPTVIKMASIKERPPSALPVMPSRLFIRACSAPTARPAIRRPPGFPRNLTCSIFFRWITAMADKYPAPHATLQRIRLIPVTDATNILNRKSEASILRREYQISKTAPSATPMDAKTTETMTGIIDSINRVMRH